MKLLSLERQSSKPVHVTAQRPTEQELKADKKKQRQGRDWSQEVLSVCFDAGRAPQGPFRLGIMEALSHVQGHYLLLNARSLNEQKHPQGRVHTSANT